MKRIAKLAVILIVAAVAAGLLTACDFDWEKFGKDLQDRIETTPFPYSEDGKTEIELNFAGIKQDTYKGINEWDIVYVEGETTKEANLTLYTDQSGAIKKSKYVYTADDVVLAVITTEDISVTPKVTTTTYVNETAKTVSDTMGSEFSDILGAAIAVGMYGIVTLTDEEDHLANWNFVAKRELTIQDMDGTDLEVVQFEYDGARETGTYSNSKMFVDFKKYGITPIIRHLRYAFYESETLEGAFDFYITLRAGEAPTEADFAVPTEADGYTIL